MRHWRFAPTRRSFVALGLGMAAGSFRLLAFRGLPNDQYMHLVWAQEVLGGAWPTRDFVDPGMPLAVLLSAAAQALAPGPFGEAVLCAVMLGLAAAITCRLVAEVSGSTLAGLLAGALEVALYPRLYGYPKILVPAVALLLILRCTRSGSRRALLLLAGWTVVAFLLRYDLGVFTAIACAGALAVSDAPPAARARAVGRYVLAGLVLVSPYLLFLELSGGVLEQARVALTFGGREAHQFMFGAAPAPPWASGTLSTPLATAEWGWFGLLTLLPLGLAWIAIRDRGTPRAPIVTATALFALTYRGVILRHPLDSRIPDLATIAACGIAWLLLRRTDAAPAAWPSRLPRLAAAGLVTVLCGAGAWTVAGLGGELDEARLLQGVDAVRQRAALVLERGRSDDWSRYWPAGELPEVITHLRQCTRPDARILLTWPAPEYYFFAQRRLAAGRVLFDPAYTIGPAQEALSVSRLRAHEHELEAVLINEDTRDAFSGAFPTIAAYLDERFQRVGTFTIRDGSRISLAIPADASVVDRSRSGAWPCRIEIPHRNVVADSEY